MKEKNAQNSIAILSLFTLARSVASGLAMTLSSVVMPQPDCPTSMGNSSMRASKLTSLITSVRDSPGPKPLFTRYEPQQGYMRKQSHLG